MTLVEKLRKRRSQVPPPERKASDVELQRINELAAEGAGRSPLRSGVGSKTSKSNTTRYSTVASGTPVASTGKKKGAAAAGSDAL